MFKFDPIDAFFSAGSTLLGRLLVFFSAGMVGLALGWVAGYCDNWSVVLHPLDTIGEAISSGKVSTAFGRLFLWPFVSLTAAAQPWFFVALALAVLTALAILVFTEESAFLWGTVVAVMVSLVPAMSDLSNWAASSWTVLGIFWLGLALACFWRSNDPGDNKELQQPTDPLSPTKAGDPPDEAADLEDDPTQHQK